MEEQIQTVEIIKQPGQTLGFYIREGNGIDKWSGVFVSRIAQGSVVAKNNLLQVNDEILSVNMVDVQKMSLDDVVILMSIAKRLVLTVKVNNHLRAGINSPHTEVISPREQAQRDGRQPIVVIKSGFNSSYNKDMSVDDKRQERMVEEEMEKQMVRRDVRDVYGTLPRYNVPMQPNFSQNYFPNQAYMLGIRSQQMSSFSPNPLEYRSEVDYLYPKNLPFQYIHPQNQLQLEQQKLQQFHQQQSLQQHPHMLHRRSTSDQMYGTLDRSFPYRIQMEWFDQGLLTTPHNPHQSKDLGYRRPISQYSRILPNGAVTNIDQYSSDSEITPRYQKTRNKYRGFYQPRGMADLEMNQLQSNYSMSRTSGLSKNKLSGSFADLSSLSLYEGYPGMGGFPQTPFSVPLPQKDYNTWLDQQLLQQFSNEQSLMSTSVSKPIPSHTAQMLQSKGAGMQPQFQPTRLTRKLSTDSLLDYNIYKMEDSKNYLTTSQKSDNRLGSWISSSDTPYSKPSRSSSASKQKSQFSHSLSRHKQNTSLSSSTSNSNSLSSNKINTNLVSNSSKSRSGQISRMPLKIQMEEFLESPSIELTENSQPLTGQLRVNVLCGYGLKSTKAALRDLYCVIEVNSMPVARTTVRTGALNFDWNEDFDFEVCRMFKMQLLLYSWDLDSKHQLCFTATTPIAHVIHTQLQQPKKQETTQETKNKSVFPLKLAIKLEPKGILYTEISFIDSNVMFSRKKTNKKNALFGAELKEVVLRERTGLSVPLIVQRCVREVESRGLTQLGVYRLSGSNKRKQQLREDLEKNPRLVDLSADGVSDINVITGVLKDYFRELPEPLCTSSLHEMLLDALSVQVPGDVEGNTQLMLGILECLPRVNQDTLAFMLDHLKKVSNNSETNKMTAEQIGLCLGSCLICPASLDDSALSPDLLQKHAQLLQCLLDIWQQEAPMLTTDQGNANKSQEEPNSSI